MWQAALPATELSLALLVLREQRATCWAAAAPPGCAAGLDRQAPIPGSWSQSSSTPSTDGVD
eukprot:26815-Eustigmatos_ZCMA.PRE.1